jgi:hypothetical protein
MMPLTWSLKEVDPIGIHRQSGSQAYMIYHFVWNRSEIEGFKFKIEAHKQKFIVNKKKNNWQKDEPPCPTGPCA